MLNERDRYRKDTQAAAAQKLEAIFGKGKLENDYEKAALRNETMVQRNIIAQDRVNMERRRADAYTRSVENQAAQVRQTALDRHNREAGQCPHS